MIDDHFGIVRGCAFKFEADFPSCPRSHGGHRENYIRPGRMESDVLSRTLFSSRTACRPRVSTTRVVILSDRNLWQKRRVGSPKTNGRRTCPECSVTFAHELLLWP